VRVQKNKFVFVEPKLQLDKQTTTIELTVDFRKFLEAKRGQQGNTPLAAFPEEFFPLLALLVQDRYVLARSSSRSDCNAGFLLCFFFFRVVYASTF
jgi:hypothetical protein